MAFGTAGGALPPPLSRRAAVFALAALGALWAPLPAGALAWAGRALLAVAGGAAAARALALLLPRPTLPGVNRRAVLVTGCCSGFGFATALALDAAGAPVLATVLDPRSEGARRLRALGSPRLRVVQMDVRSDASVAAAAAEVRDALGDNVLWAIVNNAGQLGVGESEWLDIEDAKAVMDVNTFGPLRVTRAFMPLLRESKGRIVNMISILCRSSFAGAVPYCMSKYATLALTDAMRLEVARFGISVHSIEPWFYSTPLVCMRERKLKEIWSKTSDEIKQLYGENYIDRLQKASDMLLPIITFPPSQIHRVTDSIIDACFSRDPKKQYIPSALAEAAAYLLLKIPYLLEIFHYFILPEPHLKSR